MVLWADRSPVRLVRQGPPLPMVSLRNPLHPPVLSATTSWRDFDALLESSRPELTTLSPAERVVAAYLCHGLTNKEIAQALGKSVSTVKNQVAACLMKIGVPNRARLIALVHSDLR
jgi:DNA-binding NarL/FixJ family response regulator